MLFSKSTVIALLSVITVTAEVPSPSIPDWIGVKSTGKTLLITDDFSLPGSSFTVGPTVSTPTVSTPTVSTPTVSTPTDIQPTTTSGSTYVVIPDHTIQPPYFNSSAILTATTTASRGSPGNSKNLSKTVSIGESVTSFSIVPIVTANVTITKPIATTTPGNGTNRTTSAILTQPTSLGSAITPYGAAFLVVLVGFVAMGL